MDDELREIERKLNILRKRAEAYENFVNPPGMPPLLWQMVMLAELGMTVLPRVDHPDLDKSFPEMDVCMGELQWGPDIRCFIGGDKFEVMSVPPGYHGFYNRYKLSARPYWSMTHEEAIQPILTETEVYHEEILRIGYHSPERYYFGSVVRWEGRFMVLMGSRAEERFREFRSG